MARFALSTEAEARALATVAREGFEFFDAAVPQCSAWQVVVAGHGEHRAISLLYNTPVHGLLRRPHVIKEE